MIVDDLTHGQVDNVNHNLRKVERNLEYFLDALETLKRSCPMLLTGLEENYAGIGEMMQILKDRWAYRVSRGDWPEDNVVNLSQATGKSKAGEK